MPSPFPGMNPYLDRPEDWADVQPRIIAVIANQLSKQLPLGFRSRIVRAIYYIRDLDPRDRPPTAPDIVIGGVSPATARVPHFQDLPVRRVEIHNTESHQVICRIEVIVPEVKYGELSPAFRNDVFNTIAGACHYVEIDLLRAGERAGWDRLTSSDYSVIVSRRNHRPVVEHWPISVRERLPVIRIPLSGDWPDLGLDLQSVVNQVYDDGYYARDIYEEPPEPPLNKRDAVWAAETLANTGIVPGHPKKDVR